MLETSYYPPTAAMVSFESFGYYYCTLILQPPQNQLASAQGFQDRLSVEYFHDRVFVDYQHDQDAAAADDDYLYYYHYIF